MDMRQITTDYFVSPQLDPTDMEDAARAGVTTIICNRPDPEIPPSHQAQALEAAAKAEGLAFVLLPLTHDTMTPENVAKHRAAIEASEGPTLAYCASGTRSTVVWALGEAAETPADDILFKAQAAGYDLEGLRPSLDAAYQKG
ncbi:MAG: TIGR01244 family sulfur transferase [Paracoccaceae bacterium]